MLGNFTFHNPTKLYFGENSLENLSKELSKYGEKVMLVYGGGSIRKNGIYDAVLAELRKAGKQTVELSGVMPNPTIEKVMEAWHSQGKRLWILSLLSVVVPSATIARLSPVPHTANMTHGNIISIISGK